MTYPLEPYTDMRALQFARTSVSVSRCPKHSCSPSYSDFAIQWVDLSIIYGLKNCLGSTRATQWFHLRSGSVQRQHTWESTRHAKRRG